MSQSFDIQNATVLTREIRGEDLLYIVALSQNCGIVQMMKKISAKKTAQMPDIFDDINVLADADSQSALKFMREVDIIKRRTSIGSNYECFNHASMIAECALKNGRNIEDFTTLSARLKKALDALATNLPPAAIHLKFLYLLVRDEGYAVREDFYEKLTSPKKNLFAVIIKTPSENLREFESRTEEMLDNLNGWILNNTDILL